jgi:hypothetical protein
MKNTIRFAALLALAAMPMGCSMETQDGEEGIEGASVDPITDVTQSSVKRQSIGNCWLYAVASWAESMHKSVNGEELNMSESYWNYWYWFDQIANGGLDGNQIQTGGWYSTGVDLITRYGIMMEADFIPEEANAEMSNRQKTALDAINLSLKSGVLSTAAARKNRETVRRELDRVYGLRPEVVAQLDSVFGPRVTRTLDRWASTKNTKVKRAREISVRTADSTTKKMVTVNLADAIGQKQGTSPWSARTGRYAWQTVSYPTWSPSARRNLQVRLQRAMHDANPVIMSWFVDFNALDPQGRFMAPPASPGRQGGHMVVVEDYEINNVPGFGTLKAGVKETRPEALNAALDPAAKIQFIRIKNSWGSYRPDRQFVLPGYHDLYMAYLDGPVKQCRQTPEGNTDTSSCWDDTPFNDLVLPAGY